MTVKVTFLQAGYCTHPEAIVIRDGSWKISQFPALFALIVHPTKGVILFDTGYSHRFFQETRSFPFRLYAMTTPVYFQPEDSALSQLQQQGFEQKDINYIIISHFHADHIGGLQDFPQSSFFCFNSGYEAIKNRQGIKALKAGFLSGLLPSDFEERVIFVETQNKVSLPPEYFPFQEGFDLLGDGSLLAVELSGHAIGQLGLFFVDINHQSYFLIADSCWLSRAYQEFIEPHPIANLIFSSRQEYLKTLSKINQLHKLNPDIKIIPSHCPIMARELSINSHLNNP